MTLPNWITIDALSGQIIGQSGQYSGTTQAEADAAAQAGLDTFVAAAVASGNLECTTLNGVLWSDDFEDYADGATVTGLNGGNWMYFPSPYVNS